MDGIQMRSAIGMAEMLGHSPRFSQLHLRCEVEDIFDSFTSAVLVHRCWLRPPLFSCRFRGKKQKRIEERRFDCFPDDAAIASETNQMMDSKTDSPHLG